MQQNDYSQSGFDNYFQRDLVPGTPSDISSYDFESTSLGLSANNIQTGKMQSNNQRISIDLDNENITISDGLVPRVQFGKLDDGSYGILILDQNGNNIMQISGNTNVIKSPDNSLELNFDNTQLLVRDQAGNIVALLGKQVGGF